jgi:ligand-binding SRPBCC domain-containing protein
MALIKLTTIIDAPIEQVFDLARSVDAHLSSTSQTQEKVIAGKITGLLELNDCVTWQARHLGITQKLSVRITQFESPHFFEDQMTSGAFAYMGHKHYFKAIENKTEMIDEFDFASTLGFVGKLFDRLYLKDYMTRFLKTRNQHLKNLAES